LGDWPGSQVGSAEPGRDDVMPVGVENAVTSRDLHILVVRGVSVSLSSGDRAEVGPARGGDLVGLAVAEHGVEGVDTAPCPDRPSATKALVGARGTIPGTHTRRAR
jgi:hypothetical protein